MFIVLGRRFVTLGGVKIPHERGIVAHPRRCIAACLMSILLWACALGDIGKHFPDTRPGFAVSISRKLITHT